MRVAVLVVLGIIGLILLVLLMPVGAIRKVKIKATVESNEITEYDIDKTDFTYLNWIIHETNKLSMAGQYTLIATICDPPSDCDSDSIVFTYGGEKVTYSLYVPTFVGERELNIELKKDGEVVDSISAKVFVE